MQTTLEHRPSVALAENADEILALALRFGVYDIRVFGSSARGTDTASSDVDIFAKVEAGRSYFEVGAFLSYAEELLGFPFDMTIDDPAQPAPFDMSRMVPLVAAAFPDGRFGHHDRQDSKNST